MSQCVDIFACVVSGLLMLLKALSHTTCRSFNACTYAALGWVCGSASVLIKGLESFKHYVLKRNSVSFSFTTLTTLHHFFILPKIGHAEHGLPLIVALMCLKTP